MKTKTAKGKKLPHSEKKKIENESDDEDENGVFIFCLNSYYKSKKDKTGFNVFD